MKVQDAIKMVEADRWYQIATKGSIDSTNILLNQVELPLQAVPDMVWRPGH
jgi:hypothetical protein